MTRRLNFMSRRNSPKEIEQEARLRRAERALGDLQHRAHTAIVYLEGRHHRNHWRESVAEMIGGAKHEQ